MLRQFGIRQQCFALLHRSNGENTQTRCRWPKSQLHLCRSIFCKSTFAGNLALLSSLLASEVLGCMTQICMTALSSFCFASISKGVRKEMCIFFRTGNNQEQDSEKGRDIDSQNNDKCERGRLEANGQQFYPYVCYALFCLSS